MQIQGPLKIGVVDNPDTMARELHLSFTDAFRALAPEQRTQAFRTYVQGLRADIDALSDDDDNRQGMLTICQIAESLLPHIENDEIPLAETIVVEMAPSTSIRDLLAGDSGMH